MRSPLKSEEASWTWRSPVKRSYAAGRHVQAVGGVHIPTWLSPVFLFKKTMHGNDRSKVSFKKQAK